MRGSMAASSSTSRFTCSESGSARAWENTARRTGWTSRSSSRLSCAETSSVMRAIRFEYTSRSHPGREPGPGTDAAPDVEVVPRCGHGDGEEEGQEEDEHRHEQDDVAAGQGPPPPVPVEVD